MAACAIRLTILSENTTVRDDLHCGHGLSILIEVDGRRFLLDTGHSESTVSNAEAMGIALEGLDAIVLSHGHYDHTGGLEAVLHKAAPVRLIAHPDVFDRTYAHRPPEPRRYIGSPLTLADCQALGATVELTAAPVCLSSRLMTTGEVPQKDLSTVTREGFVRETPQGLVPDNLQDDLSLIARLGAGLLLITGCAHAGLSNIVDHATRLADGMPVIAQIGGTHLGPLPEDTVRKVASQMWDRGLRTLMACHCTGPVAFAILQDSFPGETVAVGTGNVVEFDDEGGCAVLGPESPGRGSRVNGVND